MPKIVDREKTKKRITHEAVNLFIKRGYTSFTIDELASECDISKGSVYNYFESKDDIIYSVIEYEQESYDKEILYKIDKSKTLEDKIMALFSLCILDDNMTKIRRGIYNQFVRTTIRTQNKEMIRMLKNIQIKYQRWLNNILTDEKNKGNITQNAHLFSKGLFALGEAVVVYSDIDGYNHKDMLTSFIKELLKTIKGNR